ncbi:MAG: hypothetical protein HUK15_08030 [Bacteroidales bacterium]|nr:hypothetical protein [Bacteroidales bacterium]
MSRKDCKRTIQNDAFRYSVKIGDNAVVGGIPAKIISMDGSEGYVNRTV